MYFWILTKNKSTYLRIGIFYISTLFACISSSRIYYAIDCLIGATTSSDTCAEVRKRRRAKNKKRLIIEICFHHKVEDAYIYIGVCNLLKHLTSSFFWLIDCKTSYNFRSFDEHCILAGHKSLCILCIGVLSQALRLLGIW